jgi:DNA-binding NarL/FixJ family response regulator
MAHAQRFDLAVVDLVMPEREGIDIIQTLHKEQPDLKIIAVSLGSVVKTHGEFDCPLI